MSCAKVFDTGDFEDEPVSASDNRYVGTSLWFENDVLDEAVFLTNSPASLLIHDLENVGDTSLRFVTVEPH